MNSTLNANECTCIAHELHMNAQEMHIKSKREAHKRHMIFTNKSHERHMKGTVRHMRGT